MYTKCKEFLKIPVRTGDMVKKVEVNHFVIFHDLFLKKWLEFPDQAINVTV